MCVALEYIMVDQFEEWCIPFVVAVCAKGVLELSGG